MRDALSRLRAHLLRRASRLDPSSRAASLARSSVARRRARLAREIYEVTHELRGVGDTSALVIYPDARGTLAVRVIATPIDDYDIRGMVERADARRHRRRILCPELP